MRSRRTTARRGAGTRPSSPPGPARLAWLHQEVGASILGPAAFRLLRARRSFFTVADDGDPVGLNALGNEVVHRRFRAAFAESQVVLVGPALVGVTLDEEQVIRIRLQPRRVGVENPRVGGTDVV